MFKKVLVANRGEIACRVIRTLKRLNVGSVAVYSEVDADSEHVKIADEAVCIGPAAATDSYLRADKILAVAKDTGAEAIHPGYGFLSENAEFAEDCEKNNIKFVGPGAAVIRDFGLKHRAREIAIENNVALLPGSDLLEDVDAAVKTANEIGYPVMLKSTGGGGGIGMRLCWNDDELKSSFQSVKNLGASNFSNDGVFIEKFVQHARHIEVQIFGDGKGDALALCERDCSVQRRNQKVIEETPAPDLDEDVRKDLLDSARRLAMAVNYESAGTVEFIYDCSSKDFYFLEVNTRLQVEHAITEEIYGIDLVEWMLAQVSGDMDTLSGLDLKPKGHSIQLRVYAEDPNRSFAPCTGLITECSFPDTFRLESWIQKGSVVQPYYDPLIAKIIVKGEDRADALTKLGNVLEQSSIEGIQSNLEYLHQITVSEEFKEGGVTTAFLNTFNYEPLNFDVLSPGTLTTIQDFPGRVGYWDVGVPPSGPMDSLSFRLGNRLLGNDENAAGFEMVFTGPKLKFNSASVICLCGAKMDAKLDDEPISFWKPVLVKPGSVLEIGSLTGEGKHAYLLFKDGLNIPEYLGSRSTFKLGQFGGHGGRPLRVGDVIKLNNKISEGEFETFSNLPSFSEELMPEIKNEWEIGVLYGPHGAPDFFADEDIEMFFNTTWEVHYNSDRTGVRLIGPKPKWARTDGGEAGLHPSNIHDNAYAFGTVDFTGDMPVILGPDGPSLGGFVCPATIINAELWKCGQLNKGAKIKFKRLDRSSAEEVEKQYEAKIENLEPGPTPSFNINSNENGILDEIEPSGNIPKIVFRQSGNSFLLVEFGPLELDLNLRFFVHVVHEAMLSSKVEGIIDLTPGIRSLQIHYDFKRLPLRDLMDAIKSVVGGMSTDGDLKVPTRTVYLPLSWDDEATQLAIDKYTQSVRPDAPWCPSNIEFIRRINGLDSIEQVKEIVYNASYLVMGLGDVYLGAPVATPLDPRHRLVTTKYNPARTWTPENAVGIGGAYLCVYGMEGPGGYQFVGRTIQMWNRYRVTNSFVQGKPWLLRFFDQIRFYEVGADELMSLREDFVIGKYDVKVEEDEFSLSDYNKFLDANAESINEFKEKQQTAFHEERERWAAAGQDIVADEVVVEEEAMEDYSLEDGQEFVASGIPGSVWKVQVDEGGSIKKGDVVLILESMKMEISIESPFDATVEKVLCKEGQSVDAGDNLLVLNKL